MSIGLAVWIGLWCVVTGMWVLRLCLIHSARRKRNLLGSSTYDRPPNPAPRLSVVVAAKDEEHNIEVCLRTLLDQDYPNYEVIAVDDRSTDGTPAILSRLRQAGGDRLRVVTVRSLRDGWFGKNNAMREGVQVSTGDWLLFTDADCWQISRKTLTVAMAKALEKDLDLLSITPTMEARAFWEPILMPVCGLVLIAWFLPERVNNRRRKAAYANGAFMLMRRSCYELIGGHEGVRNQVNEDVHMARLAKAAGQRLLVAENDDLYRCRMYRSLVDAWHGWSRIFYGCIQTVPKLAISTAAVLLLSIFPWVSLVLALLGMGFNGSGGEWLRPVAIGGWTATLVLQLVVTWQFYRMLQFRGTWCFTYPLGAIVVVTMLLNAMLKAIGAATTTWRGTTYRNGRREDERAGRVAADLPTPAVVAAEPFAEPAADA